MSRKSCTEMGLDAEMLYDLYEYLSPVMSKGDDPDDVDRREVGAATQATLDANGYSRKEQTDIVEWVMRDFNGHEQVTVLPPDFGVPVS